MDFLRGEKRGASMGQVIAMVVLFLIVFVSLLVIFFPGILGNIAILDILMGGSKNIEYIETECELACQDMNETLFCEKERTLRLGGGNSVKGACDAISSVAIEGYVGIPKCGLVTCDVGGKEAMCYEAKRKVACKGVE